MPLIWTLQKQDFPCWLPCIESNNISCGITVLKQNLPYITVPSETDFQRAVTKLQIIGSCAILLFSVLPSRLHVLRIMLDVFCVSRSHFFSFLQTWPIFQAHRPSIPSVWIKNRSVLKCYPNLDLLEISSALSETVHFLQFWHTLHRSALQVPSISRFKRQDLRTFPSHHQEPWTVYVSSRRQASVY